MDTSGNCFSPGTAFRPVGIAGTLKMATSREDESSEESTFGMHSSNFCKNLKLPRRTWEWHNETLAEVGIFYQESSTTLHDLMSHLSKDLGKRQFKQGIHSPNVTKHLNELTNEFWSLSLDLNKKDFCYGDIEKALSKVDASIERLSATDEALQLKQSVIEVYTVIVWAWRINLLLFLTNLKKFLLRLTSNMREASYRELFRYFSGICLLNPESGDVYQGIKTIKGHNIPSKPDMRFVNVPGSFSDSLKMSLALVTVANRFDCLQGDFNEETFCYENISSGVLGQHGIELVIETKESCLWPCSAGIICAGTKLIFTYLDISREHLEKIESKTSIDDVKASIMYTRPYDFMNESDRKLMLELLFWFGFVQTGGYLPFVPHN